MLNNFSKDGKFGRTYMVIKNQVYSINGDVFVTFNSLSYPFNVYVVKIFSDLYTEEEFDSSSTDFIDISIDKALQIFCRQHPVLEIKIK
jgi:hypothetical protein